MSTRHWYHGCLNAHECTSFSISSRGVEGTNRLQHNAFVHSYSPKYTTNYPGNFAHLLVCMNIQLLRTPTWGWLSTRLGRGLYEALLVGLGAMQASYFYWANIWCIWCPTHSLAMEIEKSKRVCNEIAMDICLWHCGTHWARVYQLSMAKYVNNLWSRYTFKMSF